MEPGRRLGLQLKAWLNIQAFDVSNPVTVANHLIDVLGEDDFLRGPIRDLASQPLLRDVLERRGGAQRAALDQLNQHLATIYSPGVLSELQDLLEAATDLPLNRTDPGNQAMPGSTGAREPGSSEANGPIQPPRADRPAGPVEPGSQLQTLISEVSLIAPGLGLSAASTLVLWWAAGRLDDAIPGLHKGGGGLVLALILLLIQVLALGPLRLIRRSWTLAPAQAADPRHVWRWCLSPWVHQRTGEGLILGLALLLLMLSAPAKAPLLALRQLDLQTVVLRYGLTSLLTTVLAVLTARHLRVEKTWSGTSGVVGALVALAALHGLMHQKITHLGAPPLLVPAWVLLLVVGALELQHELPRQTKENSRAWQRILSSTWFWGTALGLILGFGTWVIELIRGLQALRGS